MDNDLNYLWYKPMAQDEQERTANGQFGKGGAAAGGAKKRGFEHKQSFSDGAGGVIHQFEHPSGMNATHNEKTNAWRLTSNGGKGIKNGNGVESLHAAMGEHAHKAANPQPAVKKESAPKTGKAKASPQDLAVKNLFTSAAKVKI